MPNRQLKQAFGNTIAEYGLIFALVLIVAFGALSMLGGSISGLLGKASNGAANMPLMNMLAGGNGANGGQKGGVSSQTKTPGSLLSAPTSAANVNTKGFITVTINRQTGKAQISVSSGATSATNTTSVEGGMFTTNAPSYGTASKSAKTLEQLAAQTKNPAVKAYLKQMSDKIFLMGAAQAELDGVKGLKVPNMTYNNPDALADLWKFNKELMGMINNPPDGMKGRIMAQAFKQAQDAYNTTQSYINALDQYIDDNGTLTVSNFAIPMDKEGKPGAIVHNADQVATNLGDIAGNTSLADGSALDFIKQASTQVLSDGVVESAKVESTLNNAVGVDAEAQAADLATDPNVSLGN